jgi:drug/metabolite transporter (DMT)-like permease
MDSSQLLGILYGILSAIGWGSGDFSGGLAARRITQYQVLAMASISGTLFLALLTLAFGEPLPPWHDLGWAVIAGISGATGVAALYQGLATGSAAVVAPISAVTSAALPFCYGLLVQGIPNLRQLMGLLAGLIGIWLVSRSHSDPADRRAARLVLPVVAGVGFGGFYILIAQMKSGSVFAPLTLAKGVALVMGLAALRLTHRSLPAKGERGLPLISGVLETCGNLFYVLAEQHIRIDIAAILAAMFPAVTVILSQVILGERSTRGQWFGLLLCLLAVALFTL